MSKQDKGLLEILSGACLGAFLCVSFAMLVWWPGVFSVMLNENVELIEMNDKLVERVHKLEGEVKEANVFKEVLARINKDEYNRETNNCFDYSKRLQAELRKIGIESSIAVRDDRGHAWTMIWLESTTGEFVKPGTGWEILELRDSNIEVVIKNYNVVDPGVVAGSTSRL